MEKIYAASGLSAKQWIERNISSQIPIKIGLPNPEDELFPALVVDTSQLGRILVQTINQQFPGAVVAVVSDTLSIEKANQLLPLKPKCIVSASRPDLDALQRFIDGKAALDHWHDESHALVDLCAQLTPKEREVFLRSCTFDAAPELAENLDLSVRTVEAHRYNIVRKVDSGSFREWTVLLRQALCELAGMGIEGDRLLRAVKRVRRTKLLRTA